MKPSEYLRKEQQQWGVATQNKRRVKDFVDSHVTHREPCPQCKANNHDKSSDNLVCYSDGDKHCFACGYHVVSKSNNTKGGPMTSDTNTSSSQTQDTSVVVQQSNSEESIGVGLPYNPSIVQSSRGILDSTYRKYGVQVDDRVHVYPYYSKTTNNLSGVKTRIVETKKFPVSGSIGKEHSMLFGQQVFPQGCNKALVITEGEEDACSAYQMLAGRFPCVSIPLGSSAAVECIKTNYDYVNSFDTIYLSFDNDEPGKKAIEGVANLFDFGKVRVIHLPQEAKDANDVLFKLQDTALFVRCFQNAPMYTPVGIRFGRTLLNDIKKRGRKGSRPYPWQGLNDLLKGIRSQEIVTVTAGTGQGKSSVLRELVYYLFNETQERIGLIFLEEGNDKTGEALINLAINKPLHLIRDKYIGPDGSYISPELGKEYEAMLEEGFTKVLDNDRLSFLDHFGSGSIDSILQSCRYMAKVQGVRYIFLDHVSIIVSSQENGDERKAIDEIMTKLRQLVQETGITLFLVSHIRRGEGGQEEGGEVHLGDLRGSASIGQISDNVISVERNQQAENPEHRNLTLIRVLKCRETGLTGPATCLYFNRSTGRLEEKGIEVYQASKRGENASTDGRGESGETYPVLKGAGGFRKLN